MISLNNREAYCISLIITDGGRLDYETLRDVVLQFRESFHGIGEHHLKYKAIKKVLTNLIDERLISENPNEVYTLSIDSDLEEYLVKKHADYMVKAIKNLTAFRRRHVLEFNLSFAQDTILSDDWAESFPYGLIEELKKAINTHQRTKNYSAVINNCARCTEIMIRELNEQYSLFPKDKPITRMISEIKNEKIVEKFSHDREERETFRVFANAVYTIYRFRNKMGAHADWQWGDREIATSCLILTLYLADLYSEDIRRPTSE